MTGKGERELGVREGSLAIAKAILQEKGIEGLSLREVARRLGVSHYAPYKHFPTRDHLLAELVRATFDDFANELRVHSKYKNTDEALAGMGKAYVSYALRKPLEYRLMFGTALPSPSSHPGMIQSADAAYALLKEALRDKVTDVSQLDDAALFVWSSLHGLVTILASDVGAAMKVHHDEQSAADLLLRHLSSIFAAVT